MMIAVVGASAVLDVAFVAFAGVMGLSAAVAIGNVISVVALRGFSARVLDLRI
jgi:hypothetical protein